MTRHGLLLLGWFIPAQVQVKATIEKNASFPHGLPYQRPWTEEKPLRVCNVLQRKHKKKSNGEGFPRRLPTADEVFATVEAAPHHVMGMYEMSGGDMPKGDFCCAGCGRGFLLEGISEYCKKRVRALWQAVEGFCSPQKITIVPRSSSNRCRTRHCEARFVPALAQTP